MCGLFGMSRGRDCALETSNLQKHSEIGSLGFCFVVFFCFLRANPLLELSNPNRTTGKEIDAEVVSWSYLVVANGVQLGYSVFKDHRRTVNVQKFFLSCSHLKL